MGAQPRVFGILAGFVLVRRIKALQSTNKSDRKPVVKKPLTTQKKKKMKHYWIFKEEKGHTELVCNGVHDTEDECSRHWYVYSCGLVDMAHEFGVGQLEVIGGTHSRSIRIRTNTKDVEFFMLLGDKEGEKMMDNICNE